MLLDAAGPPPPALSCDVIASRETSSVSTPAGTLTWNWYISTHRAATTAGARRPPCEFPSARQSDRWDGDSRESTWERPATSLRRARESAGARDRCCEERPLNQRAAEWPGRRHSPQKETTNNSSKLQRHQRTRAECTRTLPCRMQSQKATRNDVRAQDARRDDERRRIDTTERGNRKRPHVAVR